MSHVLDNVIPGKSYSRGECPAPLNSQNLLPMKSVLCQKMFGCQAGGKTNHPTSLKRLRYGKCKLNTFKLSWA